METYEKDGKVYKAQKHGFRCALCNAYMDMYYSQKHGWIDPHHYDGYGDITCSKCGQEYKYEEGNMMVLSEEQLDALRKLKGL
jgi:uncharacterized protein with PIN domain